VTRASFASILPDQELHRELAKHHMVRIQLSSGGRQYLCNHVINEAVLIPDTKLLKLVLIALFVQLLEDLQESAIVDLQNGVLCGQIQGPAQTCKIVTTSAWVHWVTW